LNYPDFPDFPDLIRPWDDEEDESHDGTEELK